MPTLLFRLCGPMQSWGTRSRFPERDTELEPSKSGVIGLICAALGRPRSEDVSDLAALRLGIRVDHEGTMQRDYHTAGAVDGIITASGHLYKSKGQIVGQVSNRYYLTDADFLVGLEGEDEALLRSIEEALRAPRWQLSLGRKSFLPSVPIYLPQSGLRQLPLEQALPEEPWPLSPFSLPPWRWERIIEAGRPLRLVLEADFTTDGHEVRMDQPLGAAFRDRTFGPRAIVQFTNVVPTEVRDVRKPAAATA
ncbi:MAG: type I-E CRISPR-associated protein Cas5/CasD [Hyphomicrobiales bacterium]